MPEHGREGKRLKDPLSITHLKLAAEWHPTKNDGLTPDDVIPGSAKKVWWKCENGPDHEWQASVVKRTAEGRGCPYCAGKKVSVTNSLASRFPEIAAEWHPTKNEDLRPSEIITGSNRRFWWQCPQGPDHEWQATVSSRTSKGRLRGCPYCSGQKVSVTNSLASLFPDVAAQWHPTKNGDLSPSRITARSGLKVWWLCHKTPEHEWQATVASRTDKFSPHGCPCCAGKRVSVTNSLATLYPDVAAQWHPAKNGALTPDNVPAGSHMNVWWRCSQGPDHEWQANLAHRTRLRSGCPFCAGRRASITNSLASLFPDIAVQWHPTKNGDITPNQVAAGSNRDFWWQCPKHPDHEWQARVSARTKNESGCPFCCGRKASISNSLATLFPKIATEWHPARNGYLSPEMVAAGSEMKVWWKCLEGPDHEWQAMVSNRTRHGAGCPYCAGQKASVTNSLIALFPEISAEWHPTKNGDLTPDEMVAGSNLSV
jgi:Zn finger protein HypA/HybF involved in hydrogenase expression